MTQQKILILFALPSEAKATIQKLEAKQTADPSLYTFDRGLIALTGFGSVCSAAVTSKYIHEVDEVWNLGITGSLSDETPLKTLFPIKTVQKFIHLPADSDKNTTHITAQAFPEIQVGEEGAALITSDFPIHDPTIAQQLKETGDLVDLEGYGVAIATHLNNKNIKMWKITSDFCNCTTSEQIQELLNELSELLAEKVEAELGSVTV